MPKWSQFGIPPIALEINKTHPDLSADFEKSKRTGQCHGCFGTQTTRIGVSYTPSTQVNPKVRYNIVANNKYNCLLENPDASNTAPYTSEEKKIFRGGVTAWDRIACVSGFHPSIDEALAIIIGWYLFWKDRDIYAVADTQEPGNIFVEQILTKIGGIEKLNPPRNLMSEVKYERDSIA